MCGKRAGLGREEPRSPSPPLRRIDQTSGGESSTVRRRQTLHSSFSQPQQTSWLAERRQSSSEGRELSTEQTSQATRSIASRLRRATSTKSGKYADVRATQLAQIGSSQRQPASLDEYRENPAVRVSGLLKDLPQRGTQLNPRLPLRFT